MTRLPKNKRRLAILAILAAVACAFSASSVHGKLGIKKAVVHTVASNAGSSAAKPAAAPVDKKPVTPQPALPLPVQGRTSSSRSVGQTTQTQVQFDFSAKKDPFKPDPAIIAKPATTPTEGGGKVPLREALPIHRFDVSQFRLIGIVSGSKENRAMVVDPNGKGYVVKPGMTIGKNDGKIVSITATTIEVVEQFRDDNGKLRKETIKIALPRKQ